MLAFSIYILLIISYFLHLPSRISVLGSIRFDFILMIVMVICFIVTIGRTIENYRQSELTNRLIKFICIFLITIPLVKWPGSVIKYGIESYLKVVFFYFFTIAFVTTEKRLKYFLFVFLACQFFRGLEPAWLHYADGYWGDAAYGHGANGLQQLDRLSGAPHDIVNANQLAWVILNTVPFIFFLGWVRRGYTVKLLSLILSVCLLYAFMLTGSRSGLICLFVVLLGFVFFSKKRKRNLVILLFVVIPASIVISGLLSPDMAERYRSIFDDSAVGAGTVHGRIDGLFVNLGTLASPYVIFGHGLGTSQEVNVNYARGRLLTHNMYIESLQEVGIVSALFFFLYIKVMFSLLYAQANKQIYNQPNFINRTTNALLVWIFMQLIYSFSCFGLSSWEWYLFGGLVAVCMKFSNEPLTMDNKKDG